MENPHEMKHLADGMAGQSRVLEYHEAPELIDRMANGRRYTIAHVVLVRPGRAVQEHTHKDHVVMYYVDPAETPVVVDGVEIMPEAGEIVEIPAGTTHFVRTNQSGRDRVSIALRIPVTK